jgi:outer membrane receptor for ferrienterochelin and colicins
MRATYIAAILAANVSAASAAEAVVENAADVASSVDGGSPSQPATPATEVLERKEVQGRRSAETAPRQVLTRAEIEKTGESMALDVLKRLPSVTVSASGALALRGLPGYTQLLVNGLQPAAGFRLGNLSADQIERIEVIRGAVAEYSAQAVAGTINIVLREVVGRVSHTARATASEGRGQTKGQFQWTREGTLSGAGSAYTVSTLTMLSSGQSHSSLTSLREQLDAGTSQISQSDSVSNAKNAMFNGSGRWRSQVTPDAALTLSPSVMMSWVGTNGQTFQTESPGYQGLPYDSASSRGSSTLMSTDFGLGWEQSLTDSGRVDLRASVNNLHLHSTASVQEMLQAVDVAHRQSERTNDVLGWRLGATVSGSVGPGHQLQSGLELQGSRDDESLDRWVNGAPDPALAEYGTSGATRRFQWSAYLQDDWTIMPTLSANVGVRYEALSQSVRVGSEDQSHRSGFVAPSASVRKKLLPSGQLAWRASLARTYRPVTAGQFFGRPEINPMYPCGVDGRCAANGPEAPDRLTNPDLRPESSVGLDLALEYFGDKGLSLSLGAFHRRISNLVRSVVTLETVGWSDQPRYVARPENIGAAIATGLELSGRFGLNQLWQDAPLLGVTASFNLYRSRVIGESGPLNRLEGQPRSDGKLALNYRLTTLPLALQAAFAWRPSNEVRLTSTSVSRAAAQRDLDASAVWTLSPQSSLHLSGTNLLKRSQSSVDVYELDPLRTTTSRWTAPEVTWRLRLDVKM